MRTLLQAYRYYEQLEKLYRSTGASYELEIPSKADGVVEFFVLLVARAAGLVSMRIALLAGL